MTRICILIVFVSLITQSKLLAQSLGVSSCWELPIVPIEFCYSSRDGLSLQLVKSYVTPIGRFSVGADISKGNFAKPKSYKNKEGRTVYIKDDDVVVNVLYRDNIYKYLIDGKKVLDISIDGPSLIQVDNESVTIEINEGVDIKIELDLGKLPKATAKVGKQKKYRGYYSDDEVHFVTDSILNPNHVKDFFRDSFFLLEYYFGFSLSDNRIKVEEIIGCPDYVLWRPYNDLLKPYIYTIYCDCEISDLESFVYDTDDYYNSRERKTEAYINEEKYSKLNYNGVLILKFVNRNEGLETQTLEGVFIHEGAEKYFRKDRESKVLIDSIFGMRTPLWKKEEFPFNENSFSGIFYNLVNHAHIFDYDISNYWNVNRDRTQIEFEKFGYYDEYNIFSFFELDKKERKVGLEFIPFHSKPLKRSERIHRFRRYDQLEFYRLRIEKNMSRMARSRSINFKPLRPTFDSW